MHCRVPTTARPATRPGAALLLGVMLLVVSATLAAIGLVIEVSARDLAATSDRRVHHARSVASSLIAALTRELDEQREDLLAGEDAESGNADSLTISGPGGVWVARIRRTEDETGLHSEAARLNVNTLPASILLELDVLDESQAVAIVTSRPHLGVRSAAEAADLAATESWMDAITVWSAEPPLSSGLALAVGDIRLIDVDPENPPETLVTFVEETGFDPFANEQPPLSRGWLYGLCRSAGTDQAVAARALDLLSFTNRPEIGLLDLNRASAAVLATLPGIDDDQAVDLVETRTRLSISERGSITWPVREEILSEVEFEQALPYLTTRTMQWSCVIEAGLTIGEEQDPRYAELEYPTVLRVVFDCSGPATRVLLLREETNALGAVPPNRMREQDDTPLNRLATRPTAARPNLPARAPAADASESTSPSDGPPEFVPVRRDRALSPNRSGGAS